MHSRIYSKKMIFPLHGSFLPRVSKSYLANNLESITKYGGRYLVTLLPGDGIGKELCDSVKKIFKALNVPIDFEEIHVSGYTNDPVGFKEASDSLRRNKLGLKGIFHTPFIGHSSYNVALRKDLDIFANVIPVKTIPGAPSRFSNIDFYIIRENMEGEYTGLEHSPVPGVIESLKVTTREKTERIMKYAFDFAVKHGRKRLTCVHKANIMKLTDGLFLSIFKQFSLEYKSRGILSDDMIVDNLAMQLVSRPSQFDVLICPNLYGNICSNIGAGLIGGPGFIPGCNIGRDIAIFEPGARHVAMDIKDRNCANPTSMILSSSWLLRHVGLDAQADIIEKSVYKVIKDGQIKTPDLNGTSTTTEFSNAVIACFENSMSI